MNMKQQIALMALRISLGMLLVWWGLAKILNPKMGVGISKKFYFDLASFENVQYMFGYLQFVVGLLVVLGLFRKIAVPTQIIITGGSALSIWSALLDPFGLFLPVAKLAPVQHLFYPSVIALAGASVMLAFRGHDRLCLDVWLKKRQRQMAVA